MSRLCRLKTASHGEEGKWAYQEIVNLREENAKQAEQIKRLRGELKLVEAKQGFCYACAKPISATPPGQDSHHCDTCANNGNTRGVCQNAACNWEPRDQDRRSENESI